MKLLIKFLLVIMLSQYSGISHLPPLFTKAVLISSADSSTSGMTVPTNREVNSKASGTSTSNHSHLHLK